MHTKPKHIQIVPYPVNAYVARPLLNKIHPTDQFTKEQFFKTIHDFFNQQDIEGPDDTEIMKLVELELTKSDYLKFSGHELITIIKMFCNFVRPGEKEMQQKEAKPS